MASLDEILLHLAPGEDQQHEFNPMIDNPESVAGEVVALANLPCTGKLKVRRLR